MKFVNKETELKITADKAANYVELLLFLYSQLPTEGISLSKMRTDIKVMDALEENVSNSEFEISDNFKESIKEIVAKSSWGIRHKALIEFGDYIESL
nr:MAG TPA: hypothetical protein [Caudoviricetes sp.]